MLAFSKLQTITNRNKYKQIKKQEQMRIKNGQKI